MIYYCLNFSCSGIISPYFSDATATFLSEGDIFVPTLIVHLRDKLFLKLMNFNEYCRQNSAPSKF